MAFSAGHSDTESRAVKGRSTGLLRDSDRLRWLIFLVFVALCFLGGGGARTDIQSLLYLRPLAVICIATLLLIPGKIDFRHVRGPLLMLGILAAVMLVQLIPLPPSIWTTLPGHGRFTEAAAAAGIAQPWRPISVTPDLTLNSLAALIVPLTALVAGATISRARLYGLLPYLLGVSLLSALLAIAQLTQGPASSFYLYRVTNEGAAVGLFANRNHQAVLMAMTFPMLTLWASLAATSNARLTRFWVAVVLSLLLIPTILVTGSRAGLLLGALGLLLGYVQLRGQALPSLVGRHSRWRRPLLWAPWIVGVVIVAAAVFLSRATALERIVATSLNDQRIRDLPLFIEINASFFPWGSGFGSFDPIYRIFEKHGDLEPQYLNHAHNDLLELAITGGLAALLLLGAFLVWWLLRSRSAFRSRPAFSLSGAFGRLGSILILILLLGSLVDYPIRTPILSLLFAMSCVWLCHSRSPSVAERSPEAEASQ